MKFKMASFRQGRVLDTDFAVTVPQIKRFVDQRPNADSFHAYPINTNIPYFLSAFRMSSERVIWQKEKQR